MEVPASLPTPPSDSDSDPDGSGEESVPADPEQWEQKDVVRCVRWVSRTFSVAAPRRHLLPASGRGLLALTEENWLQVCGNDAHSARIFHTYLQHTHAAAKGRPPPPPLPEHQASSSTPPELMRRSARHVATVAAVAKNADRHAPAPVSRARRIPATFITGTRFS
ncbi:unnamed protein product, partial [Brenthis ino]